VTFIISKISIVDFINYKLIGSVIYKIINRFYNRYKNLKIKTYYLDKNKKIIKNVKGNNSIWEYFWESFSDDLKT
jgi:hypothetical protein